MSSENVGGALNILFGLWVEHGGREELDWKAWSWYKQVRSRVESVVVGWVGKGENKLVDILSLNKKRLDVIKRETRISSSTERIEALLQRIIFVVT